MIEDVPAPVLTAFAAAFGALFGSFLNVCIYRLPLDKSVVWPASGCPQCGRLLSWYENIPVVSWIVLRGRCRTCGMPIGIRYPIIEALTATMFGLAWWYYGPGVLLASRLVLASLIGALVGGGLLFGVAEVYYRVRREEGLGMGDVKMLAMVGAFLGWKLTLLTLMLASLSGTVIGLLLIVTGRGGMKYALPFGTFLALGAAAAATVGPALLSWYLGLM